MRGLLAKRRTSNVVGQARLEGVTPKQASKEGVSHPPHGSTSAHLSRACAESVGLPVPRYTRMRIRRIAVLIDGSYFLKRLPKLVEPRYCTTPKQVADTA